MLQSVVPGRRLQRMRDYLEAHLALGLLLARTGQTADARTERTGGGGRDGRGRGGAAGPGVPGDGAAGYDSKAGQRRGGARGAAGGAEALARDCRTMR